jgi:hypothetical protein
MTELEYAKSRERLNAAASRLRQHEASLKDRGFSAAERGGRSPRADAARG